jgi:hypothetical protein
MAGKASLIFVIGFGIIMGYIILNLTELGTRSTRTVSWYNSATVSKNLASIGANVALTRVFDDYISGAPPANWSHTQTMTTGPYTGGEFTINANYGLTDTIIVRSISRFPISMFATLRDTVLVRLAAPTDNDFLSYAYLSGFSGNGEFAMRGDTLWGPVHSNGGLHIHPSGSGPLPVFHGLVTVKQQNGPAAEFLGGLEFSDNPIEFPLNINQLKIAAQQTASGNFGLHFDHSIVLEIQNDEMHIWFSPSAAGTVTGDADTVVSLGGGFNEALYTTGDLFLKGTIEGRLTAGAAGNVKITGDVRYYNNGQVLPYTVTTETVGGVTRQALEPMGTDMLGIVSENNIEIIKNSSTLSGLTLHGAYYAMDKFFVDSPNGISTSPVLDTWGTIISREPGTFGRLKHPNGNGFDKRFRYDKRLADPAHRPSYFPGGKKMAPRIAGWWENVRLPDF